MFEIYDELESLNDGACLRYMMNPNRQMRWRVYDMRYMMNPNLSTRGRVQDIR